MGADMMLTVLWRKEEDFRSPLDIDGALEEIRKAIKAETKASNLDKIYAYATYQDYEEREELIDEVDWANRKKESEEKVFNIILEGYKKKLKELEETFSWRDVTRIHLKGAIGYATGGMSWGDDTESGRIWNNLLFDSDPEYGGNIYADLIYDFLFIDPIVVSSSSLVETK